MRNSGQSRARWYAVSTQPNKEALAEAHLIRQGYRVFVPWRLQTVRHARRSVQRRSSFFPNYAFVSFDRTSQQWRSINGTTGVRSLVMANDLPLPLPSGIVEQLIACTDDRGLVSFVATLRPGDKVSILNGPFANLLGQLEEIGAKGRVRLLIELMNGKVPLYLYAKDVSRVA